MILRILTLSLCFVIALGAYAVDYYVSVNGDDESQGTRENPWRSIDHVNEADLGADDRILFEGGQAFAGNLLLDFSDSGMPVQPVVITSYGEGRATIDAGDGTGLRAKGANFLAVRDINFRGSGRKDGNDGCGVQIIGSIGSEIDNVETQGFRINGLDAQGVHNFRITRVHAHDNGSAGISIGYEDWSTDVYIGHCVAENNPGDPKNLDNHSGNGSVVGGVRGCLIEYCEAMNNGWDMPREGNGPVGIWAWNADRVVIQFCISHDNKSPSWDGGGFDLDGGVTNSILQYNLSYNNDGPGYFMCMYWPAPVWKNNIIRYNISQNDGKPGQHAGIRIHWMEGMSDAEIYNNTVYNETGHAVHLYGDQAPRMRFRNNIFISGKESIEGGAQKAQFEGNLYWRLNDRKFSVDGYDSIEAWSAATGLERVNDALVGRWGDPRLVGAGAAMLTNPDQLKELKEYLVTPQSPAIGAGLIIDNNGGRDFWGNALPADRPSLGAHEPVKQN